MSDLPAVSGYHVMAPIGEGGFGSVYLARQHSTKQLVALKIQRGDPTYRPTGRDEARFEREASLCAELRHPHIVQLLDQGRTEDGRLFAAYQYVPGETLKEYVSRMGPLVVSEAGELMGQVLDALVCAHAHGVVHRDLKPQNIMVSSPGAKPQAKVLDFGIGVVIPGARAGDYKSLTLTHELLGTPAYSAPEQLRGEPPTIKTDLYAWALVFLECLTGAPAVRGASLAEVLHQQLSPAEVPLPQAIAGHPLGALLRRALKKDAAQRCPSSQALWNELQATNLANLVGEILGPQSTGSVAPTVAIQNRERDSRKHQITVLSCALPPAFGGDRGIEQLETELEPLETRLRSQVSECVDIATRFGGYVMGTLADRLLVYFGYPVATDSDAPRALRAAIAIEKHFDRARDLPQGGARIGIHSGLTVMKDVVATGVTASIAMRLENIAPAGAILVSDAVQRRLADAFHFEPFLAGEQEVVKTIAGCYRYVDQAAPSPNDPTVRTKPDRPMVGRQKELDAMSEAWASAQRQAGSLFLVTGEAGIGKSRLVRAFWQREGTEPWWCRCLPEQVNSALFPVLELMRAQLEIPRVDAGLEARRRLERTLGAAGIDVARVIPIFCAWLSLPLGDTYRASKLSPPLQKSELLDAIMAWLLDRAKRQPLLLAFEDLHWSDSTTRELLDRLASVVHQHALLVVTIARPEFANPWAGRARVIALSGLDLEGIKTITDMVLKGRRLPEDVVQLIVERTDGIPLFIEELTRMLLETHLVQGNGGLVLKPGADLSKIPGSIRDSLVGRLDRLGSAKQTAQLAGAIGREFTRELLLAATTKSPEQAERDLQSLRDADLVLRRTSHEQESFFFRHALIRDAAYEMLTSSERCRVHKQIADALEQHFPHAVRADPGAVAHHAFEAGAYPSAIAHGVRAATKALQQSASEEAISRAQTLLKWIKKLPEAEQGSAELKVNSILTPSLMNKYGWAAKELADTAARSLEILKTAGDSPHRVFSLWWIVMNRLVAGNRATLAELTSQLRALAKQTGEAEVIGASEALIGYYSYTQGDCEGGSRAMRLALDAYDPKLHRESGATYGFDVRVYATASLARVTWDMGHAERATALAQDAVSWAREIDHVPSLGIALMYQSIVHQYNDEKEQAGEVSKELLELSARYGLTVYAAYARLMHCWATDDLSGGEESFGLLDTIKSLHAVAYFYSLLADIDLLQSGPEVALARIDTCIALCGSVDEHYYEPHLYLRRARYLTMADPKHEGARARRDLETAQRMAIAQGAAHIAKRASGAMARQRDFG
ncbi:TOMM system kinase/cyclase fusion protein [Pendulispora albinea]|uniref:TOMM system kinase/cyclase fusion protein n=1 Tax=Pendulispora albinea TaxID=2741071 RepID=A0ABZ2M7C9_9BACT